MRIACLILWFLSVSILFAHEGRTDEFGGHHVTATGEYHIHCNPTNVDKFGGHIYIPGCYHYHPGPKLDLKAGRGGNFIGMNIELNSYLVEQHTIRLYKSSLTNNAAIRSYLIQQYNTQATFYNRQTDPTQKAIILNRMNETAAELHNFTSLVGTNNVTSTNKVKSIATPKK